jgi:glyoxylase-like metal-dependent hydrolase (beta-lactamase superfamily II)
VKALPPVERVAGGVWSIPVVVPDNPIGWTQVYVLESATGPYLIDTGWNAPQAWDGLLAGLVTAGTSVADVQGVVITHHHPDHLGLAGRVRDASGCWVGMHPADTALVERHHEYLLDDPDVLHEETRRLLEAADASVCEVEEIVGAARSLQMPLPPLPDRLVVDGQLDLIPDRRLRVLHTPGHSPGHLCLHLEDEDLLLTGDHLLSTISSHVGLYGFEEPGADPLLDYLTSLRKLQGGEPAEILPAHRGRFHGVDDRVESLVAHHEERLAELKEALADGPLTPWQLCHAMTWNRSWPEIPVLMRRAALAEVFAHVRRLEQEGLVVVSPGTPTQVRLA